MYQWLNKEVQMKALNNTWHLLNDPWMIIIIAILQVSSHIYWSLHRLGAAWDWKKKKTHHVLFTFLFSQCLTFPSSITILGRLHVEIICGFLFPLVFSLSKWSLFWSLCVPNYVPFFVFSKYICFICQGLLKILPSFSAWFSSSVCKRKCNFPIKRQIY